MRESAFKKSFMKRLKKIPLSWWESINQRSIIGTPDIIGCINGRFIAIECKRSEQSLIAPLQLLKLKEINESGGLGLVAWPENADEVLHFLQQFKTSRKLPFYV